MSDNRTLKNHKRVPLTVNFFLYEKIVEYAANNGLTVLATIRFILNQFFKNKHD
jgi:hypothetical protein